VLVENTLFGNVDKVETAIQRLRTYEPPDGYYLAYSGGKDSTCIYHLAKMAGVKFDAHYNITTVDPPELVRFVRLHKDVTMEHPRKSMWQLIEVNMSPPTRIQRFCCRELKERGGIGRTVMTGVRWEESAKRSGRKMYEPDRKKKIMYLHPIIDWTEADVWEFIDGYKLPYCELYNEEYSRLGCIGCPFKGPVGMKKDFERWPVFRDAYLRAFQKMLNRRKLKGKANTSWHTPEDVMRWWISGKAMVFEGELFKTN